MFPGTHKIDDLLVPTGGLNILEKVQISSFCRESSFDFTTNQATSTSMCFMSNTLQYITLFINVDVQRTVHRDIFL